MIEKYTIQCPYPKTKWNEVEITSDNLIYSEATTDDGKGEYIGIQCNNLENEDLIKDKCIEISKLIKEIDELNKTK